MNLIKSKNFKSGSFKGQEHSYIDSVNGLVKGLGEAWLYLPSEHIFFDNNPEKSSDDISLHEDEGLANIKEYVPLVHRDLQAILYRAVSYVLSGFETKVKDVSADVMKLIQNTVRIVDSKITIIHHIASINEARMSQDDSDGLHDGGWHLAAPTSYDTEYRCDGEGKIDLFNCDGDSETGRNDIVYDSVQKLTNPGEAKDLFQYIIRWIDSLVDISSNVYQNEHRITLSHAGLRLHYLKEAIKSMSNGLHDIVEGIDSRIEAIKDDESSK